MNNNRSISNKSIFGEYEHPEDRVTAALLHIFKIGGPEIMGFVFDDFDINLEAEVNTQVKTLEKVVGQISGGYVLNDVDKQPHTFFKLGDEIELGHEVRHTYPNPYVQRQRYTSLERLQKAMTTDEL